MIQCHPQGICSRNYYLSGDGHSGSVEFQWGREQGFINLDGRGYQVLKPSIFSSSWDLQTGAGTLARARKSSWFSRSIEIGASSGSFVLEAESIFTRAMRLRGPGCDCVVAPAHPFTRRAAITGYWRDAPVVAFAFWLAATLWQRQRKSAAHNTRANAGQ